MRLSALALVPLVACAALNHAPPRDPSPELRPTPPTTPAPPVALRVVTYNVHGVDGATIAAALRTNPRLANADVVLMQEVAAHGPCSAACAAGAELGLASIYAPGHQQDGGTSGVAILARFPLRDVEIIELPYRSTVVNSARRVALAATLDGRDGPVRVIATHLDNRINPAARVAQLAPVLAHAQAWPGAVVIGGDMNTSPFLWLGHLVPVPAGIQDDRLERSVRAAGLDTPVAGSAATSQWMNMRLDAIYTRGLVPGRFGVEQTVRISDHLPLWLDARIGPAPAVAATR
ncbi:MAG: endonuclease/exonuclease/phosphatase family protein [Myxococcales bacterium]|nr:endonuclease/exonuclease/phosphatase family protein [Myxococcales bacterium]